MNSAINDTCKEYSAVFPSHEHEKTKLEMTYLITGDFFKNPPYDLESQGISIHKSPM